MLSIAKLTSSSGAASYFELDDYYSKEEADTILKETTAWHGSLKGELNLPDHIKKDTFKNLLDGKVMRDGNVIHQFKQTNKDGESIRSSGTDLTFSAPKSLSILSEVFDKKELSKMHDEAVKSTLDYVEQNFINTQIRKGSSSSKDSTVELRQTTKALFATFRHNTSRNLDPQLHTHAVVINMTKQKNETKYRSAEFKKIFENKMFLGAVYRSELADKLIKKGYEIEQTNKDGRFEIKNFPKKLVDRFSTRRQEIEKVLEELNTTNAKASAQIALKTRSKKIDTPKEILRQEWQKTSKGYNLQDINNKNNFSQEKDISKSVNHAILNLISKESVFIKEDLIKQALISSVEYGITLSDVKKEIDDLLKAGKLLKLKDNFYTTQKEVNRELSIIRSVNNVSKDKGIFLSTDELNKQINSNITTQNQYRQLTKGQKQALEHILISKEQIIGIQGSAGTGKTYMLNLVREILDKKDFEFIGLAPSSSATKILKDDANIQNTNTLQYFITRYSRFQNLDNTDPKDLVKTSEFFKNKIVVLDEASLVSNKQMLSLLSITKNLGSKLILQGDTKQLSAIEAGKPFYQMQEAGLKTTIMSDILRQKDANLKGVVESTIADNIKLALQKLGDNIVDISQNVLNDGSIKPELNINDFSNEKPNKEYSHTFEALKESLKLETSEDIVSETLSLYFSFSKEDRQKTLILTPANETREDINKKIRQELLERKELSDKTQMDFNVLKSKNLSNIDKVNPVSYERGNIIIFSKDYKFLNIKKGEELKVIERDKKFIHLNNETGNKLSVELSKLNPKTLELYITEKRQVLENELIRFTKNDKSHKFINSHTAKVINIDNNKNILKLKLENNKLIEVPKKDLKHFDYAYSSTAYSAQGKTSKNVIAVLESYRKNLTNQQTFYVEISRAKENAFLVTDNKENLIKTLEEQTGEKLSAVQIKDLNKNSLQEQNIALNISTQENESTKDEVELNK